jgi:DNA recombination protein RmuC
VSNQIRETVGQSALRTAESLGALQKHLTVIDQAQRNIVELSQQVVGLQELLANKQARGAFGEIQLSDLVRNALPPGAFELQAKLSTGTRPDCLIRLPNPPGPIAVDAKFPLEGYQAMRAAADEAGRVRAAREFRVAVLKHVRDIAERYVIPGETAESALMFLPSEAIYAELHTNFRDVIDESFRRRVWIVSPTTLWALLNTVRAVLKDVQMRAQADLIQKEVGALLEDVYRLDQRIGALQRHLDQAGEDVRGARISTDKIVRRGASIREVEIEAPQGADAAQQLPLIQRPGPPN